MFGLLARHSFAAICLAICLEDLGIPMPIPTDLLIIFAGVEGARSPARLVLWLVAISIASATGSSGLYMIVRRGGRPLIDRFGRYIHLGPEQLARSEALLKRSGWLGIAVGRAIPGLRYVTVIACGLLNVPYRRYLTAHLAGSAVYISLFLALGALFGPPIVERIHQPELWLRLLWLLVLSVGFPALLVWCTYHAHVQRRARQLVEPSYRRVLGALLLASFAGATTLAATWAAAATLATLLGHPRPLNVTFTLAGWLLGHGLRATSAYMLIYACLLLLCVGIGAAYYELVLPRLAPRGTSLLRQVLGLAVLGVGLVASFLAPALLTTRVSPVVRWWYAGGPLLVLTLALGILVYALTVVYGRALAIALLPSLRRTRMDEPVPCPPASARPTCVEATDKVLDEGEQA